MELLGLTFEFNNNERFVVRASFYFEWPELDIFLDNSITVFSTNESLCIKDCVSRISSYLVFGSITKESLSFCECNIRGSGSVTLVIGYNFNSIILEYTNTRISCTQVYSNANSFSFFLTCHFLFYLLYIFFC